MSTNLVDMCVFQKDPSIGVPDVMSLAWFAKSSHPTTQQTFRWTIDYSFVWSETGTLKPGVFFDASQTWPADPGVVKPSTPTVAGNQIGFGRPEGAYTFTSAPTPGAEAGTLYVKQGSDLPLRQASVGIGMSGAGAFAVQAQPNLNLNFTPHPTYFLAAGTYQQGEVLNVGTITNVLPVEFPPNVYSMTATLNPDNSWTLVSTAEINALDTKDEIAERRGALALVAGQ
ncbi:hypothetical protein [Saccharothrix deserti]|uniref:hypothetical protein n=1 Tax=Saccharothrix deserti TaxID=2593674 RepID=UPI00192E6F79|nr:hypothetical protein [Saccharothrix deserti]